MRGLCILRMWTGNNYVTRQNWDETIKEEKEENENELINKTTLAPRCALLRRDRASATKAQSVRI